MYESHALRRKCCTATPSVNSALLKMAADTVSVSPPAKDAALDNGASAETPAKAKPLELQKQDSPASIFDTLFKSTEFLMSPAKQVGMVATQATSTIFFGEAEVKAAKKKLQDKQAEEDAATKLQAIHRGNSGRTKLAQAREALKSSLAGDGSKSNGGLKLLALTLLAVGVAAFLASQMDGIGLETSAPEAVEKKRRVFNLFYRP